MLWRLLGLLAGAAAHRIDRAPPNATKSSGTGRGSGRAAVALVGGFSDVTLRYYPAAGMWRLPGAVPGRRRRRATVLQGARLQRVRERGRGDRHVPVLRRGPVAGGLFQRRAIAVAGGLLERRGDRPRAVEELGVRSRNNSKLKTASAGGGAYLCESFSSP